MIRRRLPFALTIGVLAAGLGLISAAGVLADKKPRPKSSGSKKTASISAAKTKSKTKSKTKLKAPESDVAVAPPPTSGHSVAYEFVGYIKTSGGQLAKLWHSREVPVQPEAQYRYVGRMKFDDWVYVWVEAQGDEALTADVISQVASEEGLDDQPLLPPEQQQEPNAQPDVFPDGGQGIVEVSPEEAQAAGQVVEQNLTEEPNPAAAQPLLQRTFQPQLQPPPAPPVPNGKPQ
jgi:hypothetical protein